MAFIVGHETQSVVFGSIIISFLVRHNTFKVQLNSIFIHVKVNQLKIVYLLIQSFVGRRSRKNT